MPCTRYTRFFADGQIRRRRAAYDTGLTVVTLIIATLLGMKLLWAADPTWGSWDDCLTAVLWGLGLNPITSSAAFDGAQWLQSQYGPNPPGR